MKFKQYIETHRYFSTEDAAAECDSPSSLKDQLRLACAQGRVERVRRGFYASNCGRNDASESDPFELVAAMDSSAVLVLHSALEAHGVAHNRSFVVDFESGVAKSPFKYRGIVFRPRKPRDGIAVKSLRSRNGRIRVTTKEQTVLDCLASPSAALGSEEVVRSVTAFQYLDCGSLAEMAVGAGPSMVARTGWLLREKRDDWGVGEDLLDKLASSLGRGPYRFDRRSEAFGWSKEWKLCLPDEMEEMRSWVTRV